MARISYTGEGTAYLRLLNHSPDVAPAVLALRDALRKAVPPRLRLLVTLAVDRANRCRY